MELNKIYCEDCRDTMKRMPNDFVDLVVTSPPYDDLRDYHGCDWNMKVFQEVATELYRVVKPGGVVVWIVGDATINGSETLTSFKHALHFKEVGFSVYDTMIYQKIGNPSPQKPEIRYLHCFEYMFVFCKGNRPKTINLVHQKNLQRIPKTQTKGKMQKNGKMLKGNFVNRDKSPLQNVWLIDSSNGTRESSGLHPAAFPEILPKRHIYSWTNKGDLVYDPFGGSGTTAKQAHILKRNWIMSEISKKYCENSDKRIEPYLTQLDLAI